MSCFPELLYKRDILKTSQNSQIKESGGGGLSKDVLKYLTKFIEKNNFARVSFLRKLQVGNLKLLEAGTGNVM